MVGEALLEPYVIGALVSVAVAITLLLIAKNWRRSSGGGNGLLSDSVFDAFFGDASVGIAVIDEHGAISRTNDVFEDMTGYDRLSLVGKLYVDLVYDPADASGRDRVVGALDRFGESHTLALRRADGTFFRARFIVSPAPASLSRNQSVVFVEAVGPDRDRERELIDEYSNAIGAQPIRDSRSSSTFGSNRQPSSSASDPAVGNFLAVLDDELITPLTVIKGYLSLIDDRGAAVPEDIVAALREGTSRLEEKLDSLLFYAKLQANKVDIGRQTVDVSGTIADAVEAVRQRGADTACVRIIEQDRHLFVATDPVALGKIVFNLIENAIRFGTGGDVEVSVTHVDGRLQLGVSNVAGGFDPSLQESVFDSFYQVSSGPARKHRGFGLGLSIVRDLVERMGGSITLSTKEGAGTSVVVDLPAPGITPLRRVA